MHQEHIEQLSFMKDSQSKHVNDFTKLTERMSQLQQEMKSVEDVVNAAEHRVEQTRVILDDFIDSSIFKNFEDNYNSIY